jgi:hypothetical protein
MTKSKYTCPVCGKTHDELPAFTFEGPTFWKQADDEEKKAFELGPDLCRYRDEHFLIRGRLQIPVLGQPDEPLEFGVWTAISRDNWWKYRTTYMDFNASALGVFYGWLANALPGYEDTINLKVAVQTVGQAMRPLLTLEPTDHQLSRDQQAGVELDAAMRYLHEWGGF